MKVAVYGSLRKGEYNFERFKDSFGDQVKVLETQITVPGFNLYSLGPYPAVQRGEGAVVVDILEVEGQALKSMDSMELGAGYDIDKVTLPNGEEARIYVYPSSVSLTHQVTDGDWSNFLKSNR